MSIADLMDKHMPDIVDRGQILRDRILALYSGPIRHTELQLWQFARILGESTVVLKPELDRLVALEKLRQRTVGLAAGPNGEQAVYVRGTP